MFKDSTGFEFYSITYETKEKAMDFVNKYGVDFPVLLVSHDTAKLLNFGRGYPTNMVLDSQGKVHSIYSGIRYPDKEVGGYFKPELEKLLKNQGN